MSDAMSVVWAPFSLADETPTMPRETIDGSPLLEFGVVDYNKFARLW